MLAQRIVNTFFDESIFTDGAFFKQNFDQDVHVANKADMWLVARLRLQDQQQGAGVCTNDRKAIIVNPLRPCLGLNVYTMDRNHRLVLHTAKFNPVVVVDTTTSPEPLELRDQRENEVYTINPGLSGFESAVMIKYYSHSITVTIDRALYHFFRDHFRDGHVRFQVLHQRPGAIVQSLVKGLRLARDGEHDGRAVELFLMLASEPVEL